MPHPRISIQLILSIDINPQNVNIIHRSIGGSFHYVGAKLTHHLSCKDKEKDNEKEKDNLHRGRYAFSVAEDFVQVLRSQDVPQGGLGK